MHSFAIPIICLKKILNLLTVKNKICEWDSSLTSTESLAISL